MNNRTLFITFIALLSALHAVAQHPRRSLRNQDAAATTGTAMPATDRAATPAAAMADGSAPRVLLGTIENTATSREKVLAYPRLIPMELGCEVTGFTFTMQAGDKSWTSEPVKGAVFTEEIKDRIKETEATKVKITIDNIKVMAASHEVMAKPITLEYDH